jgi:hypothetical protein
MSLVDLTERQGTLAWPLGWAFAELLPAASTRPDLGLKLLTTARPRLHFLAFVLATSARPATPELIDQALHKPMRKVLADMGLSGRRGLRRLLGRIPGKLMEREHYQLLAHLMADASAAPILHHVTEVSGELLVNIRDLPPMLRAPAVIDAIAHIPGAAQHVLMWIDIVSARLQCAASETQTQLGRCRSHAELRSQLEKLVDALPALDAAPPQVIGHAVRIDTPSAIRQLGHRFRNCLSSFVDAEVDGATHIYHWCSGQSEAVCEVSRASNLGWFLASHLGPQNTTLAPDVAGPLRRAFAEASIHPIQIVETYDDLYFSTARRGDAITDGSRRSRHQRRGRYHAD